MRFVIACCWPPEKGQGISTVSREIAVNLAQRGNEVFYLSPKSVDPQWYEENGIKAISIGSETRPKEGLVSIVRVINNLQPDALINNDHPYVQAALPAIKSKIIIISHTMAWGTAALVRFNHEWADSIIAISYDMLHMLVNKGVTPEKLSLVMNSIKDPHDGNWVPVHDPVEPIRVVFAGNWTRVKGADLLYKSFKNLSANIPWLKLDIYGEVKKKYVDRMSGRTWITVHRRVPRQEFLSALDNADVLLLPSRKEGCPMSVIEAMGRGVVPIVSDGYGAMRWMVDHGVDGFVARRRFWGQDMWALLNFLNNNRVRMQEMKVEARKHFKHKFDINNMTDAIVSIANRHSACDSVFKGPYRVIMWHRPSANGGIVDKIIERLSYRFGCLRKGGWVAYDEINNSK